jgi:hypothetical protein
MRFRILIVLFFMYCTGFSQSGWFKLNELPKAERRNPGNTWVGGLIFPGYAYFANDMMKEGFVVLGAEAALVGVGVYYLSLPIPYKTTYQDIGGGINVPTVSVDVAKKNRNRSMGYTFLSIAGGIQVLHAFHGAILSHRFNVKNALAGNRRAMQMDVETAGLGLQLNFTF